MKTVVLIVAAVLLLTGGLSTVRLLWRVFVCEMRWEWRLVRLAIHAAVLGAAATLIGLLFAGMLKV